MEIQNNKEEIPFSYYADLFAKADPAEIAARLDIPCENNTFQVTLLGKEYAIKRPPCAKGAPAKRVGDCHGQKAQQANRAIGKIPPQTYDQRRTASVV